MELEEHETSSLRTRRKKSSVSLGCCFNRHHRADSLDSFSFASVPPSPSSSRISPSAWLRSKTSDLPDANIKGRYKNFMSRIGRHRRHSSADFSYDPLSYSLNFEDDDHHDSSEVIRELPVRSFAARLPLSPPKSAARDGDQTRMKQQQQQQMMIRTAPQPTITRSTSTTRAAAIAEVRKSLEHQEEPDEEAPAGRTRGCLELPTPINNRRKQQQDGEEIRKSRSSDHIGELMRSSLDAPHPTPTSRKVTLTPVTSTASSTTAMAASPTSRQVLVELF